MFNVLVKWGWLASVGAVKVAVNSFVADKISVSAKSDVQIARA